MNKSAGTENTASLTQKHRGEPAMVEAECQPISDMRASAAYRTHVLGSLLQRFWLESQGLQQINLESFTLEGEPA